MTGGKQQQKKQQPEASKHVWRQQVIAVAFVVQTALIGVKGNLDVLSGKPVLDVIPSMIAQGVSLIVKAAKESDSK